jgi:hypothetical protein
MAARCRVRAYLPGFCVPGVITTWPGYSARSLNDLIGSLECLAAVPPLPRPPASTAVRTSARGSGDAPRGVTSAHVSSSLPAPQQASSIHPPRPRRPHWPGVRFPGAPGSGDSAHRAASWGTACSTITGNTRGRWNFGGGSNPAGAGHTSGPGGTPARRCAPSGGERSGADQ